MKRVEFANIPVEVSVLPLLKANIKNLGEKMTLGEYIQYMAEMHQKVLRFNKEHKDDSDS